MPGNSTGDRQFVVALSRGLDLLACFTAERPSLSNSELARLTGLACSSVSRLTHTLLKTGFLEYDLDAGTYRLGLRVLAMQPAALAGAGALDLIRPLIGELADRTGETVLLTVYENAGFVVIHSDSRNPSIVASRYIGWRYPVSGTAMGRAYVAASSDHERQHIFHQVQPADQRRLAMLQMEMDDATGHYRRRRYCMALGVARPGMHVIATPLTLRGLGRRAAMTCGGPAHQVSERQLHDRIAPLLIETADQIEARLATSRPRPSSGAASRRHGSRAA